MKKILISLLFVSTSVFAACPELYPNGKVLEPANTVELCNSFYVSRLDKNNKAVIMTSEWLQKSKRFGVQRINAFKSDDRLGKSSPTNSDYDHSGYDRGHMAPAGDTSSVLEMKESFLLSNMTPQEPTLNRGSWKLLEEKIRTQFLKSRVDFKIVTIAMYDKPKRIGHLIPVPKAYWKVVYKNEIATDFYFAENKPNATVSRYSFVDIKGLIKNSTTF